MTAAQLGLFGVPEPLPTTDPTKVLIPATRLLAFAATCEANGQRWKAEAIKTACQGLWGDDLVPVSAALVRLWGIEP